eukprot:m51a1_g14284 hypothetical protein (162) ;mRNA; f:388280-388808
MDPAKQAELLNNLIQVDIDAWHCYGWAIDRTDLTDVKKRLESFRDDHKRHVDEISDYIRKTGHEPIEFKRDMKARAPPPSALQFSPGMLMSGMTMVAAMTNQGMLNAMRKNEQFTNQKYEEALGWTLMAPEAQKLVKANRADEERHLAYIEGYLREKKWEE